MKGIMTISEEVPSMCAVMGRSLRQCGLPFALMLGIVGWPIAASAVYKGRDQNKPVAELELMDDQELLTEINSVCLSVAMMSHIYGPQLKVDGGQYAQLLARVSRKQHGGKAPEWMLRMVDATLDGRREACDRAFNAYIAEKKREKQLK